MRICSRMAGMAERTVEQLKYLEFVQGNIARMHDAATSMKRFALAAFALGGSLARFFHEPMIMAITFLTVSAFFLLDAKYLQAENAFRELHERIRKEPAGAPASFSLTPGIPEAIPIRELRSWSTRLLYGPILLVLAVLLCCLEWQPVGHSSSLHTWQPYPCSEPSRI